MNKGGSFHINACCYAGVISPKETKTTFLYENAGVLTVFCSLVKDSILANTIPLTL